MKKEKISAGASDGVINAGAGEKSVGLPTNDSERLICGEKKYALPVELSPEDQQIYQAGLTTREDIVACSSQCVKRETLLLDPLYNFTSYCDEPDNLTVGILVPASKNYCSISVETLGIVPEELYDDDFCNGLKSAVQNYINQYEKENEESY